MPEARLERTRQVYKELDCEHAFYIIGDTNLAPLILSGGNRRTIEECFNCGLRKYYDRTQEEFLKELKNSFGMPF